MRCRRQGGREVVDWMIKMISKVKLSQREGLLIGGMKEEVSKS